MFEDPQPKPVRRTEALTSFPTPCSSPGSPVPVAPECDELPHLPSLTFDYVEIPPQTQQEEDGSELIHNAQAEEEGEMFDFRLFVSKPFIAGGKAQEQGCARIDIRSPTPLSAQGEGGFLVPFRAMGYYFANTEDETDCGRRKEEYREVAVGGQEVLSEARETDWPGTALPWRLIQIPASGLARPLKTTLPTTTESRMLGTRRRMRAGKKRRIATRKKCAVEARATETEKEKRARRNREKKLKKREKNRKLRVLEAVRSSGEVAY